MVEEVALERPSFRVLRIPLLFFFLLLHHTHHRRMTCVIALTKQHVVGFVCNTTLGRSLRRMMMIMVMKTMIMLIIIMADSDKE
jgi:hypothetical protein